MLVIYGVNLSLVANTIKMNNVPKTAIASVNTACFLLYGNILFCFKTPEKFDNS